jgi:hypothetical protein
VLTVVWRFAGGKEFFGRHGFEAVSPDVAAGEPAPAPGVAGGGSS